MNHEQVFSASLPLLLTHPLAASLVAAAVGCVLIVVARTIRVGPLWSHNIPLGILFGVLTFFVTLLTFSNVFAVKNVVAVDLPVSDDIAQSVFHRQLNVDAVSSALQSHGYNIVEVTGSLRNVWGESPQHEGETEFLINNISTNNEPTLTSEMSRCVVKPLRVKKGSTPLSKTLDFTMSCHTREDDGAASQQ